MLKKRPASDKYSFIFVSGSSQFSSKKGQVTIFIILGILLLLALLLIILIQREIRITSPEEVVPLEEVGVESLISACLDHVGAEALDLIGLQGGYIDVPPELANNADVHLKLSPMHVIPYWAYGSATNIPSLQSIKERIDHYIEENLRPCLFGAGAFEKNFDLIEKSEITSDTKIVDSGVLFNVHWIIEIREKSGELVTEAINHGHESSVKLKKIHETAEGIINKEMSDLKLEDLAQDLLSLDHPDVPISGLEMSCTPKRWKISDTKQAVKDLLRVNLRELRIKGTSFIEFPDGLPYYQNHYVWDLGEAFNNPEISVLFDFQDNYPFAFDVNPQAGAYLKSSQLGGNNPLISFLCLQTWKFVYDLTFPVKAVLTDETTGYDFNMALTVHLKKNIPDRREIYPATSNLYFTSFNDEEFCENRRVPILVSTYELIENNETGIYNREPLDGVILSLSCLQHGCEVGQTEFNFAGLGNVAAYRTNFPFCAGGILRGVKDNYKDDWQRIVTEADLEVELNLVPVLKFPASRIRVVKHQFDGKDNIGPPQELSNTEMAMIKLTYGTIDPLTGEQEHEINLMKSKQLDQRFVEEEKVEFLAKADFAYLVEINVLDNNQYLGGYKRKWLVPWTDLSDAQEIIFHVLSKKGASEEEAFSLISNLEENSIYVPAPEIN